MNHRRLSSLFAGLLLLAFAARAEAQTGTPGPPTGFNCTPAGVFADCFWTAPVDGGFTPIFNYHITLIPLRTGQENVEGDTHLAAIRMGPLLDGDYFGFVQAENQQGLGPQSVIVSFRIAPAGPPRNLRPTVVGQSVTFTWDPPLSGNPPTQYVVEIGIPGIEIPCPLEDPCPPTTELQVGSTPNVTTTLPNGVYVARVRVIENLRAGDVSAEVTFIVGPPPTGSVPFPPIDLRAEIRDLNVALTWNLRQDSPQATSFLVDITPAGATTPSTVDTGSPARSVFFAGVPPGQYAIRVRARNQHGISQRPSLTVNIGVRRGTSCNPSLSAPQGLAALISGNLVTLTWSRPQIATNLSSYVIEAGTLPGETNVASFSTGNQATLLSVVAPNGTYFVRVRGQDHCGLSDPSNEITVVVPQ